MTADPTSHPTADAKAEARRRAFADRAVAHAVGHPDPSAHLRDLLGRYRGRPTSFYRAMRTEIDPEPALLEAARYGPLGLPVVTAPATPLTFRLWAPGDPLVPGGFGTMIPPDTAPELTPEVLVVPLVAFTRTGGRLGYGGGFYDRTLQRLRAAGPVVAIGFAWSAQEADSLPLDRTDQPLDWIVTEAGVIDPGGLAAARGAP